MSDKRETIQEYVAAREHWMDFMMVTLPMGDLRALVAERTWRPISDAPRDGRLLLVWSRADGEDIAQLCDGEWYVANYGNVKPTHWMPLPPPPEPV